MVRVVNVALTNRKANLHCGPGTLYERWKDIPGFSCYQVSNYGRVRRSKPGHATWIGRILAQTNLVDSYLKVQLIGDDGKKRQRSVHSLVALTFLGPCPARKEVNHKDTNGRHNWLSNLEYLTRKRNMEHAVRMGLIGSGESHSRVKLSEKQAKLIKEAGVYSEACRLGKKFGVTSGTVSCIRNGRTWKHLK